jgi:hypothetical protein
MHLGGGAKVSWGSYETKRGMRFQRYQMMYAWMGTAKHLWGKAM